MCKGITSQGRKCLGVQRDYCHHHNPQLFTNNIAPSLNSIKYYFRWSSNDNTQQITIRPEFLETNTSEATRRHLYDEIMPFLRDCWKWGHSGTDRFSREILRIHFVQIGVRQDLTEEQLGERQWTETVRRTEYRQHLGLPLVQPILQRRNAELIGDDIIVPPQQIQPTIPAPFKDSQNVHRSSVNESVNKSVEIICADDWKRPLWPILGKDGEKLPMCKTLLEKIYLWNPVYTLIEKEKVIWPKLFPLIESNKISSIMNYDENIYGKKPWIILYKTFNWIFQQTADVQKDALLRLLDELYEGREMCIAGKVSRIVNSLVGIHPNIHIGLSGKEMLQERMAALAKRTGLEPETKMEEGRGILRDANVPENEWEVWLEPLLLDY
jgi:hypothetical protein